MLFILPFIAMLGMLLRVDFVHVRRFGAADCFHLQGSLLLRMVFIYQTVQSHDQACAP
jgi:hypothetical protein